MAGPAAFYGFKCPQFDSTPDADELIQALGNLKQYTRSKGVVVAVRGVVARREDDASVEGGTELFGADWTNEAVSFLMEEARAPLPDADVLETALHEWERDVFIPQKNHPASEFEKSEFLDKWAEGYMDDLIATRSEKVKLVAAQVVVDFERSRGYIGTLNSAKAKEFLSALKPLLTPHMSEAGKWDDDVGIMTFPKLMGLVRTWLIEGAAPAPWKLGRGCSIRGEKGEKIVYDRSELDLESIKEYLTSNKKLTIASCELTLSDERGDEEAAVTAVVSKSGALTRFTSLLSGAATDEVTGISSLCEFAPQYLDALEAISDAENPEDMA